MSNYFLQMRIEGREEKTKVLQDSFHSRLQFTFISYHQKNLGKWKKKIKGIKWNDTIDNVYNLKSYLKLSFYVHVISKYGKNSLEIFWMYRNYSVCFILHNLQSVLVLQPKNRKPFLMGILLKAIDESRVPRNVFRFGCSHENRNQWKDISHIPL
jgi:hypothetical protein